MTFRTLLLLPMFALAACGGGSKDVKTATYTCAEFNKSLRTKGDDSAGNYINQLRRQAKLGGDVKSERRAVALGIYFACLNKPGSTTPVKAAVANAKLLKVGKFHIPKPAQQKKKSD